MKYTKCKRCELNYCSENEEYCKVCKKEIDGVRERKTLCPFCLCCFADEDEIMCKNCQKNYSNFFNND